MPNIAHNLLVVLAVFLMAGCGVEPLTPSESDGKASDQRELRKSMFKKAFDENHRRAKCAAAPRALNGYVSLQRQTPAGGTGVPFTAVSASFWKPGAAPMAQMIGEPDTCVELPSARTPGTAEVGSNPRLSAPGVQAIELQAVGTDYAGGAFVEDYSADAPMGSRWQLTIPHAPIPGSAAAATMGSSPLAFIDALRMPARFEITSPRFGDVAEPVSLTDGEPLDVQWSASADVTSVQLTFFAFETQRTWVCTSANSGRFTVPMSITDQLGGDGIVAISGDHSELRQDAAGDKYLFVASRDLVYFYERP